MNIMVTGGKGYMGRYIVEELLKEGHTVINYNRDMSLPFENPKNIFVIGELNDIPRLITTIQEHKVERIIHTAGQSHPDISLVMPVGTVEANTMGLLSVFEAARLTGIKRIVCYSSDAAYGHAKVDVVTEDQPLCPRTPYGVTKATAEMMARAYNWSFGMDIISLRSCAVYGPGQVMPEFARDAIKAAVSGEKYSLPRGRDQKFNMVFITDVVNASIKACFSEKRSDLSAYNISSGYQPTFGEILDIIKNNIPTADFEVGSGDIEGWDVHGFFSIKAAEEDLGYKPEVSLEQGMKLYIDWLKAHTF